MSVICEICGKQFTARRNLYAHIRIVHRLQPNADRPGNSRVSVKCGDCRFSCKNLTDLRAHVQKVHMVVIEKRRLVFQSWKDFIKWKSEEEQKSKSSFVQHYGAKLTCKGFKKYKFLCHRSGRFSSRSEGKRMLKSQGSVKIGSHCTAAIELCVDRSGVCKVEFFSTHFGHTQNFGFLSISRSERESTAGKISVGVSFEGALEDDDDDVDDYDDDGDSIHSHALNAPSKEHSNELQVRGLQSKLQALIGHISRDDVSVDTVMTVENEIDKLLSLFERRRVVLRGPSNEKFKAQQMPVKCTSHQKSKFAKLTLAEKCNSIEVLKLPVCEVLNVHVGADHTYRKN